MEYNNNHKQQKSQLWLWELHQRLPLWTLCRKSQEMHSRMDWNSMLSHHFFLFEIKKGLKNISHFSLQGGQNDFMTGLHQQLPLWTLCQKIQEMQDELQRQDGTYFFNNNFYFFNKSMSARFLKWIVDCIKEKKIKNSKRVNFGFGSFINDCPSGLYVEKVKQCTVGWTEIPCCHIILFFLK